MKKIDFLLPVIGLILIACAVGGLRGSEQPLVTTEVIVSGSSIADVRYHIESLGGEVTGELAVINAVTATLDETTLKTLRTGGYGLSVFVDQTVSASGKKKKDDDMDSDEFDPTEYQAFADQVGAAELHAAGITGKNVTVAIVDSGIWKDKKERGVEKRLILEVDTTDA